MENKEPLDSTPTYHKLSNLKIGGTIHDFINKTNQVDDIYMYFMGSSDNEIVTTDNHRLVLVNGIFYLSHDNYPEFIICFISFHQYLKFIENYNYN